jgi:hypothetical protein
MKAVVSAQWHVVSLIFSAGWGFPGIRSPLTNLALQAKEAGVVVDAHWVVNVRVPIHNHGDVCSGANKSCRLCIYLETIAYDCKIIL